MDVLGGGKATLLNIGVSKEGGGGGGGGRAKPPSPKCNPVV